MIFVHGVLFGLLLAVLIGPVFFTLIQTSIEKGIGKAILVAIGIAVSDITYIILAYFGVSQFLKQSGYNTTIAYIGGIILIAFGIVTLFNSKKKSNFNTSAIQAKGFFRYIFKGFIINGISPFVLLFWIGAMSLATAKYHYAGSELILFFAITIVVVLTTDFIKAYLANKLRIHFTPNLFKILNITVGIMLCLFGLRMLAFELL